jgi:glucuronate isomerase
LDATTAARVWHQANERLATPDLTAHGILKKFRVTHLCTTDDPVDDLQPHAAIAASGLATRVLPAFRPDKAFGVDRPEPWNAWIDRLAAAAEVDIRSLADLLEALRRRVEFFHARGCRLSDHGLEQCPADFCPESVAAQVFAAARRGQAAGAQERVQFASFVMLFLGRQYAQKGWTMQLHLGARRNNNTRGFRTLGPDTGFDSIGDLPQAAALGAYLDRLDQENALPKTILYNNNPVDNYVFATMAGNFQDGSVPGKIQFGSGWWFLDQKEGMEWQLNALSNLGLLSRFVGMVTDSRSFMSYPRHEYFRRVLCNLVGRDVENGELPDDDALVGTMIRRLCYANAREYLQLPG